MSEELISKKTRNEFREFLVGWTMREIEMEFEAANVCCDRAYVPPVGGDRRSFVEQHYHTLDFTNPADVRRLIAAYENILITAARKLPTAYDKTVADRIEYLVACLNKDGFKYVDGKISPITPEARIVFEGGSGNRGVSELTRRNILDTIRLAKIAWSGRLSETDFLSRLYDLDTLPSHDHRFKTAKTDIWQHRENNPGDWDEDWIFSDSRFDLIHTSDEAFLRFLCEMIHPVARPDSQEVSKLLDIFNQHLAADGWEIAARARISGMPVFAARRRITNKVTALVTVEPVVDILNAEYVTKQITRMEAAVVSDPELAIGTAKEFVETICKTILHECGETVSSSIDLPQLVKRVREKLDLLPEDIPDKAKGAEIIKRVLSNLGSIAQGLGELRSLYGSGHGKVAKVKGLQARHARLTVNAGCTLAVFLFETYQERKGNKQ